MRERQRKRTRDRETKMQRETERIDDGEMEWFEGVEECRSLFSL